MDVAKQYSKAVVLTELTPEYDAAVRLGYITQAAAEKELSESPDIGIKRLDAQQRKAFLAGFLWLNFQLGWKVTDIDAEHARAAWNKWCDSIGVD